MAVNQSAIIYAYGLSDALVQVPPQPILAQRSPASSDYAQPGVLWVNQQANTVWCLSSTVGGVSVWNELIASNDFNPIYIISKSNTSPSILIRTEGGALETLQIVSEYGTSDAAIEILAAVGGIAIDGQGEVTISAEATAGSVTIDSGTGGITLDSAAGIVLHTPGGNVQALADHLITASTTPTLNARLGYITVTGLTTAAAATQAITITNSFAAPGCAVLVTVSQVVSSSSLLSLTAVDTTTSGTIVVTFTNNGSATLTGNVTITFWILYP